MRRRFALVESLLPRHSYRLLEVGFGSGVFMPELSRRCDELYGIDVHDEVPRVQARLEAYGVRAALTQQNASMLTFADDFFDTVVAISTLEFVDGIERAASELERVLRCDGRLVTVMPGKSPFLDFALRVVTGESAERDYANRRERVMPVLGKYFRVIRVKRFVPVYTAYELAPKRR